MSYFGKGFRLDGRTYSPEDIEDSWGFEIYPEDETANLAVVRDFVDLSLCTYVDILQTTEGEFFLLWTHRHPEMLSCEELEEEFPDFMEATKHLKAMRSILPSEEFGIEITRRQAFELLVCSCLPEQFHAEAGV